MRRVAIVLVIALAVAACGSTPTVPTPDAMATQVAFEQGVAATLTASAPTATMAPTATLAPVASPPPTTAPTETRPPPTAVPGPTEVEPEPPIGPVLGVFCVVGVASDDVLNVRARPGVAHPIVTTIPYHGLDVQVHAGGQEVGESWWVPVTYGGVTGWANSHYVARQVGRLPEAVVARAAQAIMALKGRDLAALAALVHPDKGLRFSPYTYVRVEPGPHGEVDRVFSAGQIPGLWSDPTIYHWGTQEGSGDPIDLTFADYYAEYVYDVDFAHPDVIGFDEAIGLGSMINNIDEVYPEAVTVEYHFEGFEEQYAGYDWRSLRLVLELAEAEWVLVGIVHHEWTP